MDYKEMLLEARKKGLTNEEKMWQSVAIIGEQLEELKEAHPEDYWKLMREQHGILFDNHYGEEFAEYDVSQMSSIDKAGHEHKGEHWTKADVVAAYQGKSFAPGVTDCDKYVAANAMWHDLMREFDDKQILDAAYLFFFDDDDWKKNGSKIWHYMAMK